MRKIVLLVFAIGLLLAGCATAPTVVEATRIAPVATATPRPTTHPTRAPTATAAVHILSVNDFEVELTTISKQCFGSAGCIVEVDPQIFYNRDLTEVEGRSFMLVYEIYGDESGTIIENIAFEGAQYSSYSTRLSTASSNIEVTAKITRIIEQ